MTKLITKGRYKHHFWTGAIFAGHVVPLALLFVDATLALGLAGVLSIVGLYLYEHAFVMAPQEIPNS